MILGDCSLPRVLRSVYVFAKFIQCRRIIDDDDEYVEDSRAINHADKFGIENVVLVRYVWRKEQGSQDS